MPAASTATPGASPSPILTAFAPLAGAASAPETTTARQQRAQIRHLAHSRCVGADTPGTLGADAARRDHRLGQRQRQDDARAGPRAPPRRPLRRARRARPRPELDRDARRRAARARRADRPLRGRLGDRRHLHAASSARSCSTPPTRSSGSTCRSASGCRGCRPHAPPRQAAARRSGTTTGRPGATAIWGRDSLFVLRAAHALPPPPRRGRDSSRATRSRGCGPRPRSSAGSPMPELPPGTDVRRPRDPRRRGPRRDGHRLPRDPRPARARGRAEGDRARVLARRRVPRAASGASSARRPRSSTRT